jgi:O-antigen ligase
LNGRSTDSVYLAASSAAFFLSASLFAHTVALRLVLLAFGTACCGFALVRHSRDLRALPPIWLPFVLWAAWAGASVLWSVDPERTVKDFRNELIYAGLALWTCFIGAQARHAPRIFVPVLAVAVAVLCGVALYYFPQSWERYVAGHHGGPGNLSSGLIAVFPCILMAAWHARRTGRRWLLTCSTALFALVLAAAYTTLNRTIWIAFAVQVLLVAAMLVRTRRVWLLLALGLLVATSVMTLRIQAERAGVEIAQDPRPALWLEVIELAKERPLTGYGFGRGLLRRTLHEEFGNNLLWHAHNAFLDAVLQTGIIGLALLLLLIAAIFREAWFMTRAGGDHFVLACGITLIAILVGVIIRNLTDTLLVRQNALFFWGAVGALLAWGRQRSARASPPSSLSGPG